MIGTNGREGNGPNLDQAPEDLAPEEIPNPEPPEIITEGQEPDKAEKK